MKKMVLLIVLFFPILMIAQPKQISLCKDDKLSLLIVDTDGHDQYAYRNFILMAQSVGFKTEYRNFYTFLENHSISHYDAVFFITSVGMLKNLQSPLIQKCIKIMHDYAGLENKTIGIFAPALPKFNQGVYQCVLNLVEQLGLFTRCNMLLDTSNKLRVYIQELIKAVLKSDSFTGHLYGTTLINEQADQSKRKSLDFKPFMIGDCVQSTGMPINQNFSAKTRSTFPVGAYVRNSATGNQYFITKISEFTFADMPENFFRNPIQLEDRNEHLTVTQQMLWEMYQAVIHKGMPAGQHKASLKLPTQLTLEHMRSEKARNQQVAQQRMPHKKEYTWIAKEGISCAWEAPDDYFLYDDTTLSSMDAAQVQALKVKALDEGISFLYDAQINLAWFEFNAEAYLSEHARFKHDKQRFINQVNAIAQQLKKTAQRLKKSLPKVFIGTDITTNFAVHPVTNQAQDIFGHTYSKIPAPLDIISFWTPEVIEPFDLFCKTFGAQLPITGIFLDFEMYHAPEQATAYSDHMDFSHNTWQQCCHNLGDGSSCGLSSVAQRVDYLMHNKLFKDYFIDLENQAAHVGLTLKEHLRAIMPDLLIAVYLPTLPTSWFYRGILRGLSSQDEPLVTATFNTDFYSHAQWLADHNIHLIHGTPILLSKIQCAQDFSLITKFLQYHDFVWYNRPSRMVYRNRKGKWWSTEASDLDAHILAKEVGKKRVR
jgi:hypothetical protein